MDKNNNIIGFIGYSINRMSEYVDGLNIINFSDDNKIKFARDLKIALTDIFEKFNFRKLVFSVIIGNPTEKHYDSLIDTYGGRVVGIFKKHVRLLDGLYYDEKLYEIHREDYLKNRH